MSLSIILACLWVVVACLGAMMPSKKSHWPFAYVLIAVGIPILGFATYQHGPWMGLILMAAGVSILRWPVKYLWRWLRRHTIGESRAPLE